MIFLPTKLLVFERTAKRRGVFSASEIEISTEFCVLGRTLAVAQENEGVAFHAFGRCILDEVEQNAFGRFACHGLYVGGAYE